MNKILAEWQSEADWGYYKGERWGSRGGGGAPEDIMRSGTLADDEKAAGSGWENLLRYRCDTAGPGLREDAAGAEAVR